MVANCPYCGIEINPFPKRGRACSSCKNKYRVRVFPGESNPRIIKEEDLPKLEELRIKYSYVEEAGDDDLKLIEYDEIDKLIAKAKKAFKSDKRDEAWKIYNQALIESAKVKYLSGQQFLSSQWRIFRPMAVQVLAEGRYGNALSYLFLVAIIDVASYCQERDLVNDVAPVTLDMIRGAIKWGNINKEEFSKIYNHSFDNANTSLIKSAKTIEVRSEIADFLKEDGNGVKELNKKEFESELLGYFY